MDEREGKPMGDVIRIDDARIRDHLGEMVRGTVEETLNAMLDAEADQLCGAARYERSEARKDTRAGSPISTRRAWLALFMTFSVYNFTTMYP